MKRFKEKSPARRFAPNQIARVKARLQMALTILPTASQLPWETMSALLEEVVPADQSPAPDLRVGVMLTSDWQVLTWRVVDERSRLLGRMGEHGQRAGVPATALLPLLQTSASLRDDQLSWWCQGAVTGVSAGWSLPMDLPLQKISAMLPTHQAKDILLQWAEHSGVLHCRQLEQSYWGADSHTALQLPLPGEDTTEQFANAFALFEALGVEGVPDGEIAAIVALASKTTRLDLFAALSSTGLTQIGVVVPKPSLQLLLHLHEVNAGEASHTQNEILAAFQGMLGAGDLASVYCVQTAQGAQLLYSFFPLSA